MLDGLKRAIGRWLRIPPAPDPPFGSDPDQVRVFHAAPAYLRYKTLIWLTRQAGVLLGIVFVLGASAWDPLGLLAVVRGVEDQLVDLPGLPIRPTDMFAFFEALAVAGFLIQLPFSLALVQLDYQCRWYVVTDRSLRIREGLTRIDERTMTFSNIQNISVSQGPLQRWLGISDLEVRTAGGGGKSSNGDDQDKSKNLHTACFRGVADPGEIRSLIRRHLDVLRDSGLGDPDDESSDEPRIAATGDELAAARMALDEVRALRAVLRQLS